MKGRTYRRFLALIDVKISVSTTPDAKKGHALSQRLEWELLHSEAGEREWSFHL